jgi:hypothetical protein
MLPPRMVLLRKRRGRGAFPRNGQVRQRRGQAGDERSDARSGRCACLRPTAELNPFRDEVHRLLNQAAELPGRQKCEPIAPSGLALGEQVGAARWLPFVAGRSSALGPVRRIDVR